MVQRNLRIKNALVNAVTDERITREIKVNADVRRIVLDATDSFWTASERIHSLLRVLCIAIGHCEGDHATLSIMPHIWAYIRSQLHEELLERWGFAAADISEITALIESRRGFNVKTVTCAAYAVDPRFCGSQLSVEEWSDVSDLLVTMSVAEGVDRRSVVNDIILFRSRSGVVYGSAFNWEAALTDCCIRNPRAC